MRDRLVFYINGDRHEVSGNEALLTLTDYLRGDTGLCGTKIACAEGDCGACTVLVGKPTDDGFSLEYQTIDACIAFLFQLDRRHIVTVEGLAAGGELSPVQQAMVDCHGSQCGFCTPGFVMAMQGLVEECTDTQLSEDDMRLGLSGNLCRCTGYSQILDAGRAIDPATNAIATRFDHEAMVADFAALSDGPVRIGEAKHHESNGASGNGAAMNGAAHAPSWSAFLPATLDELLAYRSQNPEARLVSGATDLGVQRNHGKITLTDVAFVGGVEELNQIDIEGGELVIGAATSWSAIEAFVETHVPEYHQVLTRFGSPQVRHAGTLAGNLANASPIADSIPFHYVAGSTTEVASVDGTRSVPIENFYLGYKQLDLRPDELITAIRTPLPTADTRLKLYKISKRRDMDISTVTAAFWLEMDGDIITAARIATGGVGPTVVRVPRAEAALVGQPFTLETMQAAGQIARDEVTPISDVRGSDAYRRQLVENLFAKCFHDLTAAPAV